MPPLPVPAGSSIFVTMCATLAFSPLPTHQPSPFATPTLSRNCLLVTTRSFVEVDQNQGQVYVHRVQTEMLHSILI